MSELGTELYAGRVVGIPFRPVGALALGYAIKGAFPQVDRRIGATWSARCTTIAWRDCITTF